jgi:glycosyltransferase involved in cell wall biosynthesis
MREATIIVPCFNEAQRLDIWSFSGFALTCDRARLLLVNDGSRDETLDVLGQLERQFPAAISVLDLGENFGKAEAVRRGVLHGLADPPKYIGYWDADLATPLDSISEFCRLLDRHPEIDLVIGSRIPLLGHRIERRPARRLLGRLFARVASNVLRLPIYDTQCGAKLFRVSNETAALFAVPFTARWCFDVEILARLSRNRRAAGRRPLAESIYEFPLESWRDVPGSKLKPRDFVVAIAEMSRICWRYWFHPTAPQSESPLPMAEPPPSPDSEILPFRRAA